jgi:small subunit ribosomal protein S8
MQSDPLNDALSTIKNAALVGKNDCYVGPSSKLIGRVLKVMQESGYINAFEIIEDGKAGMFKVDMKGTINNCGVIKPRYSIKRTELHEWESRFLPAQDFGVLILTTTEGVVSHLKAKKLGVGDKLLAYVY